MATQRPTAATRATGIGGRFRLRLESGGDRGLVLPLPADTPFVIGRGDDTDFRLFDDRASRRHCELAPGGTGTGPVLRDLDSRNGTWIDGRRIESERPLSAGERFSVGSTTFRLIVDGDDHETVAVATGTVNVRSSIAAGRVEEVASAADRSDRVAGLFRLQSALRPERGPGPLLDTALARIAAAELLDADALVVRVFGEAPDTPDRHTHRHPTDGPPLELDPGVVGRVRNGGEALLVSDLESRAGGDAGERVLAGLFVPLKDRQQVIGLLYADRRGTASEPFSPDDLSFAVQVAGVLTPALQTALRVDELRDRALDGPDGAAGGERGVAIVGNSDPLLECLRTVAKAAPTDVAVLISGETGTGKELLARAIHQQSAVADGPFVALNCAAIPHDLLEAELFGHEAGAFTGANRARPGKFELADGGTLFLDEIGETPPEMQTKLLRALQERRFYRVGGISERHVRFRLVTATNRNLQTEVREGRFREDLLFRIRVVTIHLPPLRERSDDVRELATFLLDRLSRRLSRRVNSFTDDALEALVAYRWPGNVRELENVVERAVVLTDADTIRLAHLPAEIANPSRASAMDGGAYTTGASDGWNAGGFPEAITLREAERRAIVTALRETGGKKGETAKLLGTSWPTLNKKIRDYEIDVDTL